MSARAFRTLNRLAMLFGFLLVAVPLTYFAGPTAEGAIAPIIKDADRSDVTVLNGGHVCWDTVIEKVRDAVPAYALYTTMLDERPMSIFVTTGKGTPLTRKGFANHPAGDRWVTRYCTDLPDQLLTRPRTISGVLYYQVPCGEGISPCAHHWSRWRPSWWLVPQALTTVHLPVGN